LVHGLRSNYPITFVLHNNANYGLTTGQASSLTPQGQPMNTSPNGIPEHTLASMDLIFSLNPTFVARGFSGDIKLMARILKAAIQHRGFAFVEMLQACPTYNHFATHEYLLDRYFDANADGHDPGNLQQAKTLATEIQDRIPCGVLYQHEDIPHFYDRLIPRQGLETTCVEEVRKYDVSEYWKGLV
jgi:2-oxoglutarate/2-oxoacid ferredoxin oxidoreductase subunit beta